MSNALVDFYRCPAELVAPAFDAGAVDNLRLERYSKKSPTRMGSLLASEAARWLYYQIRPLLSDSMRKTLQRISLRDWSQLPFPRWPVDTSVEDTFEQALLAAMRSARLESIPFIWFWPEGASSAAIMTHDVEASAGLALVPRLMDVDDEFGIKASFQLVPEERYVVSNDLLETIRERQFEVNVHGLNHDGDLFRNRKSFLEQSGRINEYVEEFGAKGFRSACMYRNVDWLGDLEISYDMSVPNVAHLEPQRGGCCTVFPYLIDQILEIPLTTIQDYSLFNILGDYSIDLWKRQIEMIAAKHGLLSFIVHPDYVFAKKSLPVYKALLAYLSLLRSEGNVWIARPADVNQWWRERNAMKLTFEAGMWRIEGRGRDRARIGFACIENDRIVYKVGHSSKPSLAPEYELACMAQ